MNSPNQSWQKLAAAARRHRDDRPVEVPLGFATRVVARSSTAAGAETWSLLEKFALRGLIVAFSLCLVASTFDLVDGATDEAESVAAYDMAEILEQS